ncbi:ferrous iron transport protein A [Paeniglutamicibacter antarcticus]|uniref:Ferrous iron transport protein A n=1 Tax=Arthrobacter terrae TaxID=2935737 RepID=A0A931CT01_9MICC|nr:ferrous iron transport protein A [Arthrobacter terrae]MBG0740349.1 ferrous iron transport protein A [Arthrobacter terrae]
MDTAANKLQRLPIGTRVVVRYRIPGGLTDALGFLKSIDAHRCTVSTRAGDVDIALADIQAAKSVPPAPERRPPAH